MTNTLPETAKGANYYQPQTLDSKVILPVEKIEQGRFRFPDTTASLGRGALVRVEHYDILEQTRATARRQALDTANPHYSREVTRLINEEKRRFVDLVAVHEAFENDGGAQTQAEKEIGSLIGIMSQLNGEGEALAPVRDKLIGDRITGLAQTAANLSTIIQEQAAARGDLGSGIWFVGQHQDGFGAIPVLGVGVKTNIGKNNTRIRLAPITVDSQGNQGFAPASFSPHVVPYFEHPDAK